MTQEQIEMTRVIAEYDGWVKREYQPVHGRELHENDHSTQWLDSFNYLTDLNMLHPIAMKVMDGLRQRFCYVGTQEYVLIHRVEMACHVKPNNGQYIDLFTAVFNGIVFLNEQNVKP